MNTIVLSFGFECTFSEFSIQKHKRMSILILQNIAKLQFHSAPSIQRNSFLPNSFVKNLLIISKQIQFVQLEVFIVSPDSF